MGPAIVAAYPEFANCKRVCDIGGGRGTLVACIVKNFPHLTGVILDRPEAAENAVHHQRVAIAEPAQQRLGEYFHRQTAHRCGQHDGTALQRVESEIQLQQQLVMLHYSY